MGNRSQLEQRSVNLLQVAVGAVGAAVGDENFAPPAVAMVVERAAVRLAAASTSLEVAGVVVENPVHWHREYSTEVVCFLERPHVGRKQDTFVEALRLKVVGSLGVKVRIQIVGEVLTLMQESRTKNNHTSEVVGTIVERRRAKLSVGGRSH